MSPDQLRPERADGSRAEDRVGAVLVALALTRKYWIIVTAIVSVSIGWISNTAIQPRRAVADLTVRVDTLDAWRIVHTRVEAARDSAQDQRIDYGTTLLEALAVGECLSKPRSMTARMGLPCTRLLSER